MAARSIGTMLRPNPTDPRQFGGILCLSCIRPPVLRQRIYGPMGTLRRFVFALRLHKRWALSAEDPHCTYNVRQISFIINIKIGVPRFGFVE